MKNVLRQKTVEDVTYKNEYEALNVLEQLLIKIIEEEFNNNLKLRNYVRKRINGARDVLKRVSRDYVTPHELRSMVLTKEATKKGLEHQVKLRNIEGKEVVVKKGVPDIEAWYTVKVSRYRFKCSCYDAIFLSSIADKRLKKALISAGIKRFPSAEPVFYRYVLCKHTLAKIAKAMATGEIGVINIDKEFVDTLKIGLYAIYLREVDEPNPEITRRIYRILRRRMR